MDIYVDPPDSGLTRVSISQLQELKLLYQNAKGTKDIWLQTSDSYCFCVEKPDLGLCQKLIQACTDGQLQVKFFPSGCITKDQRNVEVGPARVKVRCYVKKLTPRQVSTEGRFIPFNG